MTAHSRKRKDVPLRLPPEELKSKIAAFVKTLKSQRVIPPEYDTHPGKDSVHNDYKRTNSKKKAEARARIEWCER